MLFQILLITFFAGVIGTGIGGLLGSVFCRDSDQITGLLISFAAGIMLSVVCFSMISDAILPENASRQMNILLVDAGIAAGFLMVWGLNIWILELGSKSRITGGSKRKQKGNLDGAARANRNLLSAGIVMILAIAIHNLPEGMVIGASYAADAAGMAGLLLAVVIGIHNIPEGMAVSVALANGGVSRGKAIFFAASSGFPTVVGSYIGWKLGTMGEMILCLMLSFAAGAMLYVVMGELIPEALKMWDGKMVALSILTGMLVGMIIIYM